MHRDLNRGYAACLLAAILLLLSEFGESWAASAVKAFTAEIAENGR